MNGTTNAARTLSRTIVVAALVALLAAATAQRAAANQQGDPVGKTTSQMGLCGLLGGTAVDVDTVRTVGGVFRSSHTCEGGLLDGVTCHNFDDPGLDYCVKASSSQPDELPAITSIGEIDAEPNPLAPAIEADDEVAAPTDTAAPIEGVEEPAAAEADAADEGGAGQAAPVDAAEGEATLEGEVEPAADAHQGAGDGATADAQEAAETGVIVLAEENDQQP